MLGNIGKWDEADQKTSNVEILTLKDWIQIMPFAATWMDVEIIMLSEVRQWETNTCYHLNVESKKEDTNKLVCRTETDSQTLQNLWLPKGKGCGEGVNRGSEMGKKCSKIRLWWSLYNYKCNKFIE